MVVFGLFLARSWAVLGSFLGRSWAALGPLLAALGPLLAALGVLLGALGPLLGRSWAALGRSWAAPGRSWGANMALDRFWSRFGCVCAVLCARARVHTCAPVRAQERKNGIKPDLAVNGKRVHVSLLELLVADLKIQFAPDSTLNK